METVLIYAMAGAVAGLAAGVFGIGGGLVIVPVLLVVFDQQGISELVSVHLAVGTSLATIIVTSLSSIHSHYRLGNVLWPVLRPLTVGLIAGALLGSWIASWLPGNLLRRVFALFAFAMALRMAFAGQPPASRTLPGHSGLAATGVGIGSVASIVGIGGGGLTVPFLVWCGTPMRNAVGTSSASGMPVALAGTLGYILAGSGQPVLPAGSTGYVYWPAVVGITSVSVFLAPMGARLAARLPAMVLKRAFAVFLVFVGLSLLRS